MLGRIYSEEQPGDAATALFIKKLTEEDAGDYRCTAVYASNQQLEARVDISVYSESTLESVTRIKWTYFSRDHVGGRSPCPVRQSGRGLQSEVCRQS